MSRPVAILCHTIAPYHLGRYMAFAERVPDTVVVELASSQGIYHWNQAKDVGFRRVRVMEGTLDGAAPREVARKVRETLTALDPRCVLAVGYSHAAMRAATNWARHEGVTSLMVTDTWEERRHRWCVVELVKGTWCRWAYDGVFVSGARGADYFRSLGFPERRIWTGCSVVDNCHYAEGARKARLDRASERARRGLPANYFVCVARFSPEKNHAALLQAYAKYRRNGGTWDLVLIGRGPEKEAIEGLSEGLKAPGVTIIDWKQYDDLPAYLALARALLLPSLVEPWGLVVNEAMACGLPVIVSRSCGCVPELCRRGLNGWDFDPRNPDELAEALSEAESGRWDLEAMGRASESLVSSQTPETWAETLYSCVRSATARARGGA